MTEFKLGQMLTVTVNCHDLCLSLHCHTLNNLHWLSTAIKLYLFYYIRQDWWQNNESVIRVFKLRDETQWLKADMNTIIHRIKCLWCYKIIAEMTSNPRGAYDFNIQTTISVLWLNCYVHDKCLDKLFNMCRIYDLLQRLVLARFSSSPWYALSHSARRTLQDSRNCDSDVSKSFISQIFFVSPDN